MKNAYIGVIDSGIGGLTSVKELIRQLPEENVIFIGDNKHMPYGSKSRRQIFSYVRWLLKKFDQDDLKALVIACNTVDSVAGEKIEKKQPMPVFRVIKAAADEAVRLSRNKKIAIMATEQTVRVGRYETLIHSLCQDAETYATACPELVEMIENALFHTDPEQMKKIIASYVDPFVEKDIDTLILGCTHYDVLLDMIQEMYPQLQIVSSSRCVISDLKQVLEQKDLLRKGPDPDRQYYVTANRERFQKTASLLIDNIEIQEK